MKKILLVRHVQRPAAIAATEVAMRELEQLGIAVVSEDPVKSEVADGDSPELVLAMGGDGTILAAAESARRYDLLRVILTLKSAQHLMSPSSFPAITPSKTGHSTTQS